MASTTDPQGSEPALDELVFLARSRHRVALLRELSGEERTRRALEEATGISQPTLGRILGDFEEREWVSNEHNGAYTLSPVGSLLAGVVEDLVTVLDSSHRLAELADALPLDRFGFDLRHLATAIVTMPSEADPLAHMRRFDELAADAETVRVFSNVLACAPGVESSDAHRAFLADLDELLVTADDLTPGLDDPGLREWLGNRIAAGELALYRYDGPAEFLLGLFDDTVGILPIDDAGMPTGLIETTAEPVRDWGRETFEADRAAASPLTPEALAE